MNGGDRVGRRNEILRWLTLGALIAPLPLLEIRAPLIGQQLNESLRLTLALMGGGVGLGLLGASLVRRRGSAGELAAVVLASVSWLATAFVDRPGLLGTLIVLGLAASWAALLGAFLNGISGRGVLGTGAVVLGAILLPLAIAPDWRWEPLAATCGVIALLGALARAASSNAASLPPPPRGLIAWRSTMRSGVLLSVAAGVTWGTTPAVNRVTWQQFRAPERYASITVLGGAVFAIALAVLATRRSTANRTAERATGRISTRHALGLLIAGAFAVIAWAPSLAITMIARSLALGGADLLIAGVGGVEDSEHQIGRWPFAVVGVVGGLMFSAVVTVTNSIDPRAVVAFLSVAVVISLLGDLVVARSRVVASVNQGIP